MLNTRRGEGACAVFALVPQVADGRRYTADQRNKSAPALGPRWRKSHSPRQPVRHFVSGGTMDSAAVVRHVHLRRGRRLRGGASGVSNLHQACGDEASPRWSQCQPLQ